MGPSTQNLGIPHTWTSRPWEEVSVNIVNSAWKGRIGFPKERKDRSCQCLGRLARTNGSERCGGVNRFVRSKNEKCVVVMASGVEDPVG